MIVFFLKLICKNIFISFKIIIKSFEYSQVSLFKSNRSFCYTWSLLWTCSVIMGRIEAAFVEVVYFALSWPCMFLVKSANTWNVGISFKQQHSRLSLPFSLIWVNMSKQLCWHGNHQPNVYTVLQNRGKLMKEIPYLRFIWHTGVYGFRMLLHPLFPGKSSDIVIVAFFSCVKLVAVSYAFLASRGI